MTTLLRRFAKVAMAVATSVLLLSVPAVASASANEGPAPSTWGFDTNGRLSSIPEVMEATYDDSGQLKVLTFQEPVKGGVRTTTYTLIAGGEAGKIDVRMFYSQNGDRPLTSEINYREVSRFSVEPYFRTVQSNGKKVPVTTLVALEADPRTILAGIKIVLNNHESSRPIFLGEIYRAHLSF
ncbi:MAG: hypothetical protein K8F91_27675 [Candidatus Obscuribacterales bacterium]|nr:hypothetical protein [Candidatus Obscuribacterales bacterium]